VDDKVDVMKSKDADQCHARHHFGAPDLMRRKNLGLGRLHRYVRILRKTPDANCPEPTPKRFHEYRELPASPDGPAWYRLWHSAESPPGWISSFQFSLLILRWNPSLVDD